MDKRQFAFGKENYLLLGVAVLVIIIGFVMMSGGQTTEETGFNPEIFSARRIQYAPIVTMLGFFMVIVAILFKSKDKQVKDDEGTNHTYSK